MSVASANKPRVFGIVGILILSGLINLFSAVTQLNEVNANPSLYYGWVLPLLYGVGALGVLDIIAAVLIMMYKRIGLYLGLAAIVIVTLLDIFTIANGAGGFNPIAWALRAAIVYYLYKYLATEPDKSFFS